jgi:hypothetical protein
MGPRGMGASTAADPLEVVSAVPHAGTGFILKLRSLHARLGLQHLRQPYDASAETIGCDARTGNRLTMAGPSLGSQRNSSCGSFADQAPREKVAEKRVPLTGLPKSPPCAANQNSDNKQR